MPAYTQAIDMETLMQNQIIGTAGQADCGRILDWSESFALSWVFGGIH